MKKKLVFAGTLLLAIVSIFAVHSCSNSMDEDLEILKSQEEEKVLLSQEISGFKSDVVNTIMQDRTRNANTLTLSDEQIRNLRASSLEFLKSQGFEERDYRDFMKEDDPRLILYATLYAGILETNIDRMYGMKNRSEGSGSGGDNICYDIAQVSVCMLRAVESGVGIDTIMQALTGKCLTKAVCKALLKTIVRKVPWIAVAVALDTFIDCMGWYPWS